MSVKLLIILLVVLALISYSTSDDIAKRLKDRYNNVKKCKKGKPAYYCTGIMIRGVNNQLKLSLPWGMKDKNKKKEAFSLAYLRRDQQFSSIHGCDSGFILYPHSKTPRKKNTYKAYCSFPFNGATDYRTGHGCGNFNGPKSNHCNKQNINSFDAWKSYFRTIKQGTMAGHCAFDMTKKSAAKYFDISLKANTYMQKHLPNYAFSHNEIRMHYWNERKPKKLPIEAFYYVLNSAMGKRLAEKYQDQFYSRGGGTVPIVGIRLPTATKRFKIKNHKRKPRKIK